MIHEYTERMRTAWKREGLEVPFSSVYWNGLDHEPFGLTETVIGNVADFIRRLPQPVKAMPFWAGGGPLWAWSKCAHALMLGPKGYLRTRVGRGGISSPHCSECWRSPLQRGDVLDKSKGWSPHNRRAKALDHQQSFTAGGMRLMIGQPFFQPAMGEYALRDAAEYVRDATEGEVDIWRMGTERTWWYPGLTDLVVMSNVAHANVLRERLGVS